MSSVCVEIENRQVHSQHRIFGAEGQGLGKLGAGEILIIGGRQSTSAARRCVRRQTQRPRNGTQSVMRVRIRRIKLRRRLQLAESLRQAALFPQCQAQATVRGLDLGLHLDGLSKSLLRCPGVVLPQQFESVQDQIPCFLRNLPDRRRRGRGRLAVSRKQKIGQREADDKNT